MTTPALTGLVLAGGGSHRMGVDKAVVEVGGVRLVDRVAGLLAPICERVLIGSGDGERLPGEGWRQVADEVDDGGPLAGIAAGLRAATTPLVAVVAVDMPFADPRVLTALAERHTDRAVVVSEVDGRLQPLHAVWSVDALPGLRELLAAGERSVVRAVEQLGATIVPERDLPGDGRFATNVNRPEDLDRIR